MFSKGISFRIVKSRDCEVKNSGRRVLKTSEEKEKMLVTNIFSYSHFVFNPIKEKFYNMSRIQIVVCNCFNPLPNKPWFLQCHVCSTRLWETLWEKEKLLVTSNFSFSHSVFYLFEELCHSHQIWNCLLQTLWVWKILKCVVCNCFKLTNLKFCYFV